MKKPRVIKFNKDEVEIIEAGKANRIYKGIGAHTYNRLRYLHKKCPTSIEVFWRGQPSYMFFWMGVYG